ncbi:hypothetical protein N7508_004046 [Penicillium antarcticum]|uniref:uncharacterized protein n=1 Tax=Penicillium antarcticum TaxID=416450 RepID=UPI0023A6ACE2|nr:uncharacterized protein N7508_004046 [Penicillium antarcticum]KAJ5308667.1 hypothetical protein N7508_004046 [Penicillium antarcticum]
MSIAKFTQRITARSQDKYAQGTSIKISIPENEPKSLYKAMWLSIAGTGDLERNGQVSSTRMPFLEGVSRQKPTAP